MERLLMKSSIHTHTHLLFFFLLRNRLEPYNLREKVCMRRNKLKMQIEMERVLLRTTTTTTGINSTSNYSSRVVRVVNRRNIIKNAIRKKKNPIPNRYIYTTPPPQWSNNFRWCI